MALGGGTFLTQNKILLGSYINFISAARASANISDRGYVAMALELDWGVDGEVFTVENADFQKESLKILGYDYTSEKLKGLRDLFRNTKTAYLYRINSGEKATNTYGTAKYSGLRGNDIKLTVEVNVDDNKVFDVTTLFSDIEVDIQTVKTSSELNDNDYVIFKKDVALTATAGLPMSGGTNKATVTGAEYQTFLDKIENYSFNTMGCLSTTEQIIDLFVQFTKRMRDEVGAKFQTVVYHKAADYEGIISIENSVQVDNEASLVYWVTGASAGCNINKSNTNRVYDGEFNINADYKQSELEKAMRAGKFVFHKVGDVIRVLDDINTFISATVDKNEDFNSNQTIRVLDQIANDIAVLFNTRYLGKVQNNDSGRVAFWNDIVTYNKELETLQAIENFKAADVTVTKGNDKKSVTVSNAVTPVNCMTKLYMTVVVS